LIHSEVHSWGQWEVGLYELRESPPQNDKFLHYINMLKKILTRVKTKRVEKVEIVRKKNIERRWINL
jgi:hypothetical protein